MSGERADHLPLESLQRQRVRNKRECCDDENADGEHQVNWLAILQRFPLDNLLLL